MSKEIEFIRTCKGCGNMFPATDEYFATTKSNGKLYLHGQCRSCIYAKNRQRNHSITTICQYDGCEKAQHARGYCSTHHKHLRAQGALEKTKNYPYKDVPTYNGMHQRIRLIKGYAHMHNCIKCSKRADDWALMPSAQNIIYGVNNEGSRAAFSTDTNDYQPMCSSCHLKMDHSIRKAS